VGPHTPLSGHRGQLIDRGLNRRQRLKTPVQGKMTYGIAIQGRYLSADVGQQVNKYLEILAK